MGQLTKSEIEERFSQNIGRVRSLAVTYGALVGPGSGRAKVEQADILRAAIILLHAALEDLLRSVEELLLPGASKDSFGALKFLPETGSGKDGVATVKDAKEKFSLVELADYRGRTVDDVIAKAIDFHLERSNYNNIGELKAALDRVGINNRVWETPAVAASLAAMMTRRHLIAHRADRNPMSGRGHHLAQSVSVPLVNGWTTVVDTFGKAVLSQIAVDAVGKAVLAKSGESAR
jgi:hypothetical protein